MKDLLKFYLSSFFRNQRYFAPVFVLFLQFHHLSISEVFLVLAAGSIAGFILEIPTGVIADIFGKKRSIIIARIAVFASYVIFGFSDSFWMLVIANIVFEFGWAMRSGTEGAFVYEFVSQHGDKIRMPFTELKSRQKFFDILGASLAAFAGGTIALFFGFNAVFLIGAVPALANVFVAVSFREISERKEKPSIGASVEHVTMSFRELRRKKGLMLLMLNATLFASAFAVMNGFIQPYMVDVGIGLEWFGIIYAASLAAAAFGALYTHRIEKALGGFTALNIISMLAFIPALVIGLGHVSVAGVALLMMVLVLQNVRLPISSNQMNLRMGSGNRATLGSVNAMSKYIGSSVALPIAGFLAEAFSLHTAMLVFSIVLLLNFTVFYLRKERHGGIT